MQNNTNLCNDLYSKCVKKESELNSLSNEILKGTHDKVLDRILYKIEEKLTDFDNSITLIENAISDNNRNNNTSNYDKQLWKSKLESIKNKYNNISKSVYRDINIQKKKTKQNSLYDSDGSANTNTSSNLGYIVSEHDSLQHSIRVGRDIEKQETYILHEMENQNSILGSIRGKVNTLFNKAGLANNMTKWLVNRGVSDTWLMVFLMIFTLFIIYVSYVYIKPAVRGFFSFSSNTSSTNNDINNEIR